MKLLRNEAYKLFIKRYLLIIFSVCMIAEILIAFNYSENIKISDIESQNKYEYYMSLYSGELSEEIQNEINALIEKDESISELKDMLNKEYINREITDSEYEDRLKEYNEYSIGHNGFEMFIQAYQSAVDNGKYLIDQRPWSVLFGEESIDFILVIFIVISVVLLTVYDEESGAGSITFPTEKGKSQKWFAHLIILVFTAAFVSMAISMVRYLVVNTVYGLENPHFSINNIELFYESAYDLSIIQGYALISFIKAFGAVYLAAISFFIGTVLRQSLLTIFSSFALTFLPNYIFADREYKYFIPLPSSFLTANGYLFGDKIYDIVYFKSLSIKQIVTVILITVLIIVVSVFVSYLKAVMRKKQ